jgi:hypothetical protein
LLDHVSQVGSSDQSVLEVIEDISAKRQVEWVQVLWSQVSWNVLGKFRLKVISALSLSLGSKAWFKSTNKIGALSFELGWGVSLWHLSAKGVDKVSLEIVLDLVDDQERKVGLSELVDSWESGNSEGGWEEAGWEDAGAGDEVVEVVAHGEELDAALVLEFLEGQELELVREDLALEGLRNGLEIVGVRSHQVGDLVVAVRDLLVEDDAEL